MISYKYYDIAILSNGKYFVNSYKAYVKHPLCDGF